MEYLITQNSGKQTVFIPNSWQDVDYLTKAKIGDRLLLKRVLFLKAQNKFQLGTPFLPDVCLSAVVVQHIVGKKILILKTKPKKKYTRIKGHKQKYTRIKILKE